MENEKDFVYQIAYGIIVFAIATAVLALSGLKGFYGRYHDSKGSLFFGCKINGKLAWIIQEAPCVFVGFANLYYANKNVISSTANQILLALFLVHYIHRTFIFPLKIRGGKPTPFFIFLMAFAFCLVNGYIQTAYLTRISAIEFGPRVLVGVAVFVTGMFINIQADYILLGLRKEGETDYKIPQGGMFKYISGANFFGEIVEWMGFAIGMGSIVGFSFFLLTLCMVGTRALHHHEWYLEKFKDSYPKNRKALIPFLL